MYKTDDIGQVVQLLRGVKNTMDNIYIMLDESELEPKQGGLNGNSHKMVEKGINETGYCSDLAVSSSMVKS